jgi:hypothetical protein
MTNICRKPAKSKEEAALDEKEFLPIGSPAATMRLIKDLKNITKANPKDLVLRGSILRCLHCI